MSKKATGIVAYLTWIGLLVAYLAGDREGAKFHLNQALVLWIVQIVCNLVLGILVYFVPLLAIVNGVVSIVLFVFWILGLVHAIKEEEKELPLIGQIKILK